METRGDGGLLVRCATCGATFATEERLIEHQREQYHGWQCLKCGATMTTRARLTAHLHRDHGRVQLAVAGPAAVGYGSH